MENQSYHHGDLKSELIREGLKILDEEGYEGFSLRKVAKACNVSQTAPYRHFKNKDELIYEIMQHAMIAFNNSLEMAVDKYPGDPKSQLREMGVMYVKFFTENPEYLRLIFLSDIDGIMTEECGIPDDHLKSGHPFSTFYRAVERYKAQSADEKLSFNDLLMYCWGLVHGISVLLCTQQLPHGKDYLEHVIKVFWSDKF